MEKTAKIFALRRWLGTLAGLLTVLSVKAQPSDLPWAEPQAVSRAFVYVPRAAAAVRVDALWRLPLDFPELEGDKAAPHVAVYRTSDGKRVDNVYVREFSPDRVVLAFEAPSAGNYAVYGVPYGDVSARAFSQGVWMERCHADNYPDFIRFLRAETVGAEYRNVPQGGDPYAVCATRTEADTYFSGVKGPFQAYFVPAEYPLNGHNRLPLAWVDRDAAGRTSGGFFSRMFGKKQEVSIPGDTVCAGRGETALVQIGVACTAERRSEIFVRHTSRADRGILLRTVGGDTLRLDPGELRSVWIAVRVSDRTPAGAYDLSVRLECAGTARDVPFVLQVGEGATPGSGGDAEFVSRIGLASPPATDESDAVNPRFPVTVHEDYRVRSGRNVLEIDPATALPRQIFCEGTPLLAEPVLLVFATENGVRKIGVRDLQFVRREGGAQVWRGSVSTHDMQVEMLAGLSAYGLVRYRIDVKALSDIDFRNITLEAGFSDYVRRACCDTLCVADGASLSIRPREGFSGLWLGGERGGVFVTVDADSANAFYGRDDASIALYKNTRSGLIVGSGALRLLSGERITLRCAMQILPADYASWQYRDRNILWVRGDTLPLPARAEDVDVLIVDDPFVFARPENDRRAREFFARGVEIVPYLRSFCLPTAGFAARALLSMGYAGSPLDGGRRWCFVPTESLVQAMDLLYREVMEKEYVTGVLLADTPYDRGRLTGYSLRGSVTGKPFSVWSQEETCDISLLGLAPWIDAVVTADTLGAEGRERPASSAGLTEYFRTPQSSDRNVLAALALGRNVYGSFPDTVSLRWAEAFWRARRTLGLQGAREVRFYSPEDRGIPVLSSNPFVRLSAYEMPDRLVVVCRNTAPTPQQFVPQFDFEALKVKRWEVDRLECSAIDGLQSERVFLVDDKVPLGAEDTAVLSLRWTRRSAE